MTTAVETTRVDNGGHPFRDRLLDGLAASITERGYRDTTVADIVRHARTSKRTFYDEFAGKESCFLDLLRANNSAMIAKITAATDPEADWKQQIRQAVEAYVDHIASQPAITLTWIRELPALGAAARPTQRSMLQDLTEMLVELTGSPGFHRAGLPVLSRPLAVFLVGGLREITALFVEDGHDLSGITEPAITASVALVGHRPS